VCGDRSPVERHEAVLVLCDNHLAVSTYNSYLDTWSRNGYRTQRGQPIANLDLVQRLERAKALAQRRAHPVRVAEVRAHRTEPRDVAHDTLVWRDWHGNHCADELAVAAVGAPSVT